MFGGILLVSQLVLVLMLMLDAYATGFLRRQKLQLYSIVDFQLDFQLFFQLNSVITCYVFAQLIKFIYIYLFVYVLCRIKFY